MGVGGWKWSEINGCYRRLSALKKELVCHFKLVSDMIGNGIKEFANDVDGPTFLKWELLEESFCFLSISFRLSKLHGSLQT